MGRIVSKDVEKPEAPVLCETDIVQKISEQKKEAKDKRKLALVNKIKKDMGHEKVDITKKSFEVDLRKVATKGVVRLFNTVKEFHLTTRVTCCGESRPTRRH